MSDPLIVANRRRRRIRRIVLIAATPVLLLVLGFGAKVLSMYAFAHEAIAAYAAGEYAQTVQASRGQEVLNIFEPYKAPYNRGVGLADAGELDAGRAAFEEALALAHGLEQCAVRVNLSIVLERIGDAALLDGDGVAATAAWQQALAVLDDAPEACGTPEGSDASPDPSRDMSEEMDEQQDGLREKLEDSAAPGEEPDEGPEPPPTPDGGQLDELKDRLEQGAQDRDDYGHEGDGAGSPETERPW